MRAFSPALAGFLSNRPDAIHAGALIWLTAKDRATGLQQSVGFWNGLDHRQFDVGGQMRTYYGAGSLIGLDRIVYGAGLEVRMHTITFSAISPEVEQAVRAFDARFAPVEVHGVMLDVSSGQVIGAPWMELRGTVDEIDIRTPAIDGEGGVDLKIASATRALTRTLSLKRGDTSQQLRQGDRFRRYADLSGSIPTSWMEA